MHEAANTIRPGPAVNETLCQAFLLAHRLVSVNPKKVPTCLLCATFKNEPRVLQCPCNFIHKQRY